MWLIQHLSGVRLALSQPLQWRQHHPHAAIRNPHCNNNNNNNHIPHDGSSCPRQCRFHPQVLRRLLLLLMLLLFRVVQIDTRTPLPWGTRLLQQEQARECHAPLLTHNSSSSSCCRPHPHHAVCTNTSNSLSMIQRSRTGVLRVRNCNYNSRSMMRRSTPEGRAGVFGIQCLLRGSLPQAAASLNARLREPTSDVV